MLQLTNISLAYGGEPILQNLSWTVSTGERIGLIGPNGAGKTTVLRVITGKEEPDEGSVQLGGQTVGYLEQGVHETEGSHPEATIRDVALEAFSEVLDLEARETAITDELQATDDYTSDRYNKLLNRLSRVQEQLNTREAHTVHTRTDAMLTGLGFEPDELDRPIRSFSGGWRMRVALARLLLQRPNILLLDEPTNHLDIDSIDWLEEYLRNYDGTVIIVSHDRFFLDRMISKTAEMAHGQITVYDGNYSYYLEERVERRKLQRQRYENQQKKIKEIQAFIDKFRYNASKAAQVQSRIKKLERMDRIAPPPSEEAEMTLHFPAPVRSGRVVMDVSEFSKVYDTEEGTVEVFDTTGPLSIERGQKVALIGPNGAGKSTLMRILRGTEPFQGEREEGYRVEMNFFAQHQAETLDFNLTVLDSLRQKAPDKSDTELRTLLGAFLFTGDDVFKEVGVLSGGERSRVALARMFLSPANFLLLDEPTNHLDLQSKQVLADALKAYEGTFVVVSHDRHFLSEVADQIWRVDHARVQTFPGDYQEYKWHREHGSGAWARDEPSTSAPAKTLQDKSSSNGKQDAPTTSPSTSSPSLEGLNEYQLNKKVEKTEGSILQKENRQEELQERLSDPDLYDDPEELRKLKKEYAELDQELATLYDEWEELAEHAAYREEA